VPLIQSSRVPKVYPDDQAPNMSSMKYQLAFDTLWPCILKTAEEVETDRLLVEPIGAISSRARRGRWCQLFSQCFPQLDESSVIVVLAYVSALS